MKTIKRINLWNNEANYCNCSGSNQTYWLCNDNQNTIAECSCQGNLDNKNTAIGCACGYIMKHKLITILMGLCILLVSGCTKTESKQDAIIGGSQVHHMEECKLSDIVSQIHFIPLETNDSVLVGEIRRIKQRNGYFYILADRRLLKFSLDGKFERNMVGIGGGPLEASAIADYDVYKDKLYILSPGKILEIDSHNNIRTFSMPDYVGWGRLRTTDHGILVAANNPGEGNSAIMLLDYENGSVIKELVIGSTDWDLQRTIELIPVGPDKYMHQLGRSDNVLLVDVNAARVDTICFTGFNDVIDIDSFQEQDYNSHSKQDFDTETLIGICNSASHYFWAGLKKSAMTFYISDRLTGQTLSIPCDELIDDITFSEEINNNQLIGMLSFNESDDDFFISFIYPEIIKDNTNDAPVKFKSEYNIIDSLETDSNPLIVRIKFEQIQK